MHVKHTLREVVGVLHVPGGMIWRRIQRFKVVPIRLDLGRVDWIIDDFVSQAVISQSRGDAHPRQQKCAIGGRLWTSHLPRKDIRSSVHEGH